MIPTKTYRRKPLEVEAIQWVGDVVAYDVIAWIKSKDSTAYTHTDGARISIIQASVKDAPQSMRLTDYAYVDIDGSIQVASHTEFEAEYEDIDTRLSVNINSRTAADLRRTAQRDEITYTELVRRAVDYYALITDERANGNAIYVGRVREALPL